MIVEGRLEARVIVATGGTGGSAARSRFIIGAALVVDGDFTAA